MHDTYYSYWGKAEKEGERYHLLAYHCLDVAAVLEVLFETNPLLRERVELLSPLPFNQTLPLFLFFTALHDIGKFSLPFQNKRLDIADQLGIPPYTIECTIHHTTHGWWLYQKHLFTTFAAEKNIPIHKNHKRVLSPLVSVVMGHHGTPVDGAVKGSRNHFKGTLSHAAAFACDMARMFIPSSLNIPADEESFRSLSWLFSGLCVLADWIGSNNQWFPFQSDIMPLNDYRKKQALPQARKAVSDCGLLPPTPLITHDFHTLLPHLPADAHPSPLQSHALSNSIRTQGPQLHIFEDLTGGGKTEAALLATHALITQGEGHGLYVGLPTMATANAMYSRLADSYQALFSSQSDTPSLMLAHGARHINQQYISSIPLEKVRQGAGKENDEPFCATWLADNRKKALLAPCGAGTLDQALLAILPVRHQSLRLAGLAQNILVADEVHAYDEYTTELLCTLLSFQGALGGSVILLSATMPQNLRYRLTEAFALGAGYEIPEPAGEAFPLATCVDRLGIEETPIASVRSISAVVELTDDETDVYKKLLEVRQAKGCAIWIRNTVEQAKTAYTTLIHEHAVPDQDILLFHARFTLTDRRRIENKALRLFGKNSTQADRAGKILIATQVVEQSLDLDADFITSDLAPMELMLQRLGREHRHIRAWRPKGFEFPILLVLSPDPTMEASASWYEDVLGKAKYVYPRPALLWRTARLLKESGRIDLCPDDQGNIPEARRLIEKAYGGMEAPEVLEDTDFEVLGELMAARALAAGNILPLEQGYTHTDAWYEDIVTPTRLGEETVQLRLLKIENETISLWAGNRMDSLTCALSEVRIAARKIADPVLNPKLKKKVDALLEKMPDKGKWCTIMPLRQVDEHWECTMEEGKGRVIYNQKFGLEIEKD